MTGETRSTVASEALPMRSGLSQPGEDTPSPPFTSPALGDTMIDRMAKAIRKSGAGSEDGWAHEVASAYAALEVMKEPTVAMRRVSSFEAAEIQWPKMIQAALDDGTSNDRPSSDEDW